MPLFEFVDLKKVRRAILYAAVVAAALILQNVVLCRIPIFGVKAMIIPAVIAAIGLFEDGLWGGIFGIAAGLCCDMASIGTTVLMTVVFALIGFLSGLLTQLYINKKLYSYVILALLALLLLALVQTVPLWIYSGARLSALVKTGLLQSVWSIPFSIPAYYACRAVSRGGRRE